MFRKLRATLTAIAFLCCGILLVYRGLQTPAQLQFVKSKIHNFGIDALPSRNGNINYSISFDISAWGTRHGISLGSEISSKDQTLYLSLDSTKLYKIIFDPTVIPSEGIIFDVRSIVLDHQKIFEKSTATSIISGVLLFFLGLVILYFVFIKRQEN